MKIALLGDIAFFGRFSIENNKDVYQYFEKVSEYLSSFDYVIGNLETPMCNIERPVGAKSAHIKSSPENANLLKYLGICAVNLANNHIFDFGREFQVEIF